ncbi:Coiled-coil domain-containing protein 187 [Galemys pyrenaicus]|uniref:Coiled-coil domain-containing protein 187 n=1 Tax=Galemys pyrenaicus TaxID=202257 RepID=A0A8J6AGP6_GALPY|nr:Coiled-coil domain-containing protein 187 [Galemys pyrenaicus]
MGRPGARGSRDGGALLRSLLSDSSSPGVSADPHPCCRRVARLKPDPLRSPAWAGSPDHCRLPAAVNPAPAERMRSVQDAELVGVYAWRAGRARARELLGPPPRPPQAPEQGAPGGPGRPPGARRRHEEQKSGEPRPHPHVPSRAPGRGDRQASAHTPSPREPAVTAQAAVDILRDLRRQIQAGLELTQDGHPWGRLEPGPWRPWPKDWAGRWGQACWSTPQAQDPSPKSEQARAEGTRCPPVGAGSTPSGQRWSMPAAQESCLKRATAAGPRPDPSFPRPRSPASKPSRFPQRPWSAAAGGACSPQRAWATAEDWEASAQRPWSASLTQEPDPPARARASLPPPSGVQEAWARPSPSVPRGTPGEEHEDQPARPCPKPRGRLGRPYSSECLRAFMRQRAAARRRQALQEKAVAARALELKTQRLREVYREQRAAVVGRTPLPSGRAGPVVSQTSPGIVTFVPHALPSRGQEGPGSPGEPALAWSKVTSGMVLGDQEAPGSFCLCLNRALDRTQTLDPGGPQDGGARVPGLMSPRSCRGPLQPQDPSARCLPPGLCIYLAPEEAAHLGMVGPLHFQYKQARVQALETMANILQQRIDILTAKLHGSEALDGAGVPASGPVPLGLPGAMSAAPAGGAALVSSRDPVDVQARPPQAPSSLLDGEWLWGADWERRQSASPRGHRTSQPRGPAEDGHSELEGQPARSTASLQALGAVLGGSRWAPGVWDPACGSLWPGDMLLARGPGLLAPGTIQSSGPARGGQRGALLWPGPPAPCPVRGSDRLSEERPAAGGGAAVSWGRARDGATVALSPSTLGSGVPGQRGHLASGAPARVTCWLCPLRGDPGLRGAWGLLGLGPQGVRGLPLGQQQHEASAERPSSLAPANWAQAAAPPTVQRPADEPCVAGPAGGCAGRQRASGRGCGRRLRRGKGPGAGPPEPCQHGQPLPEAPEAPAESAPGLPPAGVLTGLCPRNSGTFRGGALGRTRCPPPTGPCDGQAGQPETRASGLPFASAPWRTQEATVVIRSQPRGRPGGVEEAGMGAAGPWGGRQELAQGPGPQGASRCPQARQSRADSPQKPLSFPEPPQVSSPAPPCACVGMSAGEGRGRCSAATPAMRTRSAHACSHHVQWPARPSALCPESRSALTQLPPAARTGPAWPALRVSLCSRGLGLLLLPACPGPHPSLRTPVVRAAAHGAGLPGVQDPDHWPLGLGDLPAFGTPGCFTQPRRVTPPARTEGCRSAPAALCTAPPAGAQYSGRQAHKLPAHLPAHGRRGPGPSLQLPSCPAARVMLPGAVCARMRVCMRMYLWLCPMWTRVYALVAVPYNWARFPQPGHLGSGLGVRWWRHCLTGARFTLQMLQRSLREERLRAQHQAALLRLREGALEEKMRAELAWLEHRRWRGVGGLGTRLEMRTPPSGSLCSPGTFQAGWRPHPGCCPHGSSPGGSVHGQTSQRPEGPAPGPLSPPRPGRPTSSTPRTGLLSPRVSSHPRVTTVGRAGPWAQAAAPSALCVTCSLLTERRDGTPPRDTSPADGQRRPPRLGACTPVDRGWPEAQGQGDARAHTSPVATEDTRARMGRAAQCPSGGEAPRGSPEAGLQQPPGRPRAAPGPAHGLGGPGLRAAGRGQPPALLTASAGPGSELQAEGRRRASSEDSLPWPSLQESRRVSAVLVQLPQSSDSLSDWEPGDAPAPGLGWAGQSSTRGCQGLRGGGGRLARERAEGRGPHPLRGSSPRPGSDLSEASSEVWGQEAPPAPRASGPSSAIGGASEPERQGPPPRWDPGEGQEASGVLAGRADTGTAPAGPPRTPSPRDGGLSLPGPSGASAAGGPDVGRAETRAVAAPAGRPQGPRDAVQGLSGQASPEPEAPVGLGAPLALPCRPAALGPAPRRAAADPCPGPASGVLPELLSPVDEVLSYSSADLPSSCGDAPFPPPPPSPPAESEAQASPPSEDVPSPPAGDGSCPGAPLGSPGEDTSAGTEAPSWSEDALAEVLSPGPQASGPGRGVASQDSHLEEDTRKLSSGGPNKAVGGQ